MFTKWPTCDSKTIIKFADDRRVVGLITNNNEAAWCQDNNFSLNVSKTKELIVDYRKRRAEQAHIHINGAEVEWVQSFKFLVSTLLRNCNGPNTPTQS